MKTKHIQFKILQFCNGLVFFAPVAILLRTQRGVTLPQFFLLQALLSVTIFLFEIPTGVLTDRIGYKRSILLSQIILLLARFIFLIANHLIYFVLEAVLEAFACCFMSGTSEAYLYEVCKRDDEDDFMVESAKANAWGTAGFIVSTLAYAVLYRLFGLNGLVVATELATVVSIVAVCMMPSVSVKTEAEPFEAEAEPSLEKEHKKTKFPVLPKILWKFMLADAAIGLIGLIINFLYAKKLEWSGIPVEWMTFIILAYSALDLLVPKVLELVGKARDRLVYSLFALGSFLTLMVIFVCNNYVGVAFMMLTPFLVKIVGMHQYNYENKWIDRLGEEGNRATLLSTINMGNNLLEILFLLLSAVLSSGEGNILFLFAAIVMFMLAVLGSKLIGEKME